MAPRNPQGSNPAEDVVFGNLGLEGEDLGLGDDNELDLEGEGEGEGEGQDDSRQQLDDLRDSHTDDRQQQRDQSRQQRQQGDRRLPPRAEVRPDAKGNLVDATGKIVARAGAEARLYQDTHRARQALQGEQARTTDLSNRLNRAVEIAQGLQTELQTLRTQQEAVKQFNFKPEDQLNALQLYSELRSNPSETIKKLLTRAAASGINLTSLGIQPGSADPKALIDLVKEEIGKVVKPINDRSTEEQQQRQQDAERAQQLANTQNEVNSFFSANPDAKEYMPVFHQILSQSQFAKMSLGEIWARIQLNLLRNGGQQRQQNSRGRRSLPSGRGAPQEGNSDMAPVNQSYDEILRDVMTEQGIR